MEYRKCEICLFKRRDFDNLKKQFKFKERAYCKKCFDEHEDFIKGKVWIIRKGFKQDESK